MYSLVVAHNGNTVATSSGVFHEAPSCCGCLAKVKGGAKPTGFKLKEQQLEDGDLCVGTETKKFISSHSDLSLKQFYKDVRHFF